MLYSSTAARFEDVYSDFAEFCSSSNRTDVKKYFDKNWKTCLPMWSNFERKQVLTRLLLVSSSINLTLSIKYPTGFSAVFGVHAHLDLYPRCFAEYPVL
ncbi:hypothetical protein PC122_g11725 [Phytophthora cactorum]|nr:hypothetical protein PC122_g11725 [Phytophthora cactorum]